MKTLCVLIAAAFCSVAIADDLSATAPRPALAGYCVQTMRYELQMDQAVSSCGPGITAQQCDEFRATLANDQRTFDLWRVYGLGLGMDGASEFPRGVTEANADIAYVTDFVDAHPPVPSSSEQDTVKALKAATASDPRMKAIQDRMAECQRGPPL